MFCRRVPHFCASASARQVKHFSPVVWKAKYEEVVKRADDAAKHHQDAVKHHQELVKRIDEAARETSRRADEVARETSRRADEAAKRADDVARETSRRADLLEYELAVARAQRDAARGTLSRRAAYEQMLQIVFCDSQRLENPEVALVSQHYPGNAKTKVNFTQVETWLSENL